ncbi:MAG TPA: recombinase family protein, partial [Dehalococcoidia bacterium]|nr:recombinase family protein [Dehalococcoidia bacterium]
TDYLKRNPAPAPVVIVTSVDRLGATPTEAAKSLFQLEAMGARLVSLAGEGDPTRALIEHWGRNGAGPALGERVREAMRKKAIRGEVLGRPPYGYRVGEKHRLEPIPEEASVVRYIFRLYTREGLGIRLIARRLNEEGLRTRTGGNWSMITIRDILMNRAYLGTYTRFGVRVPGSHAAIVTPDDYRRVQDRMASRRTGGGTRHVRQFLLSGLAYCGYCGNKMIGVSRHQSWTRRGDGSAGEAEYRYYQCLTRTNQSMCDYHTWRASKLEEAVRRQATAGLKQALETPNPAEAAVPSVEEEVDKLRQRLRSLDRKLEQYLQAAAAGQLTAADLRELSVDVTQEQMETDEAINALEGKRRVAQTLNEQRQARRLQIDQLETGWDGLPFDQRQSLLRAVVETVTVLDDGCLVTLRG